MLPVGCVPFTTNVIFECALIPDAMTVNTDLHSCGFNYTSVTHLACVPQGWRLYQPKFSHVDGDEMARLDQTESAKLLVRFGCSTTFSSLHVFYFC
jgi:hypothetical protein